MIALKEKKQLAKMNMSLDGRPAKIQDYSYPLKNARIYNIETGEVIHLSWQNTKDIILNKDGRFES